MQTVDLPIVGQAYESRSKTVASSVCLNMYPEKNLESKTPVAEQSIYGKKRFSTGTTDANRGIHIRPWNGNIYMIHGQNFYKCDSAGNQTNLGAVSGTGRCVFDADASYVYAATGDGNVWRTDGATVEQVTDSDLESPVSLAYINSQLVYDGTGQRFAISDAGDGGTINPLNYASEESLPDDLIRPFVHKQIIYMCGTDSIAPWYNPGTGTPPVSRINEAVMHVGLAGVHSIAATEKHPYFLGADKNVYKIEGYTAVQETTIAMANEFEEYSTVSDCFAYAYRFQGLSFVVFTFPTANRSWSFCEEFRTWTQIGGIESRDKANGYCFAFGKRLVTDYRNGNILELDRDTYDDDGDALIRERSTPPVTSALLGVANKPIIVSRVRLMVESGVGLATGQGVSPVIMCSVSKDGGRSWGEDRHISLGVMGDYTADVKYDVFAYGHDVRFNFRVSDPVNFAITGASVDMRLAGR